MTFIIKNIVGRLINILSEVASATNHDLNKIIKNAIRSASYSITKIIAGSVMSLENEINIVIREIKNTD